ncbi:MAG: NAD(P)H-dependent oxidoreductase [Exiguobacterium marinum]|uniref:NAD(P)H-dependent oxidoreductase n=1 Tax=Exiguobacterium marinum TaxID=273528 RepID=A0ABY7WYV9_9BACL|nr:MULTISPECIES: NAD(P)H-dependent oxidoreductase [Exiguobacterium]WDH76058.1 NAD(P)H-dependent oxidoreductase [Exiguobacterium marinum]
MKKKDILEAYRWRQATKEFDADRKIKEDDMEFILETGRLSPSSFGFEPWQFVVVRREDLLQKIKDHAWGAQGQALTASHFVLILARTPKAMRYDADYIRNIVTSVQGRTEEEYAQRVKRVQEFQENDYRLLDDERVFQEWIKRQTYIPLGNMMTAAAQIEIDSCPIEGFNQEEIDELLISEGVMERGEWSLSVMVAFGYRSRDFAPKTRRDFNEVVKYIG